jgi:hypothetical protein
MSPVCTVIVDPFSSGATLAESLCAKGADCVAVISSLTLPDSMRTRFDPGQFREVIPHDGHFETTAHAIRRHQPQYVMAGFESGVELAERLSAFLGLPGNGESLPGARRDKFLMTSTADACGLRTARQFASRDVAEMLTWIGHSLDWPVIVKPVDSVASDHVFCCHRADQVRDAAESILSNANILGVHNEQVLVQEFLAGVEYAVDTVSYDGQRKLTAIWQYDRPTDAHDFICYDAMRLLPYDGPRQRALRQYAFDVLDALEIRFGPAHCELMWVDDEPCFIEVGARLSAGVNATISRTCGGICQLDETVDAILAPDRFLASLNQQPSLTHRAANVFLIPTQQGRLIRTRGLHELRRLPTLHSMSVASKPGTELARVAGLVTLVDADEKAIERDIELIRSLEREGMFEVE